MKSSLTIIAICLSSIAIVISLAEPVYNFLRDKEEGTPSFDVYEFRVSRTSTRLKIDNNGTGTAHNIRIHLIFGASALPNWEATEFIPEIRETYSVHIEIPIGQYHLQSTVPEEQWFTNAPHYEAYVHITSDELFTPTSFHFENFIK